MLMTAPPSQNLQLALEAVSPQDEFVSRHIGPRPDDEAHMLSVIGAASRQALIEAVVPAVTLPSVRVTLSTNE